VPEAPAAWVWLARIRRPQGRKGEVFAEILTDFPDKFAERRQVWLLGAGVSAAAAAGAAAQAPLQVELKNHWLHKGGVVLHFVGVDSISAAETLAGMVVVIPRTERAELSEDEVYISDLVGCTLVDVAGAEAVAVGTIENVDRTAGAAPLLVVRGANSEVLVPFAKSYLRKLDFKTKRVEMALPEGLVDLSKAEEA
jgi:16S rRNA processing protein RimM